MAAVVFSSQASMDATTGMLCPQISGLLCGAAIANPCTPCYIDTDGTVKPCDGTAADKKAVFAGICPRKANVGEPVTLFGVGAVFKLADETLTPGAVLYLSATAGSWDTAATTGDATGHAQAISASSARVTRNV